jgi:kinesin family protein 2/24
MEAFFRENKDSYIKQVATFQLSQDQAKCVGCEPGEEDTVIGARVRPLLPNEIKDSEVVGISVRPEAGYADVHELRRKINGQPTLNVKGFFLPCLEIESTDVSSQSSSFRLDKVYGPNQTSEDVYHDLVAPLVSWAWGGGISTLFAYGQTGSGKTYSVSELERLAAVELMNGNLEGNRDVYICVFELVGKEAFGKVPAALLCFSSSGRRLQRETL